VAKLETLQRYFSGMTEETHKKFNEFSLSSDYYLRKGTTRNRHWREAAASSLTQNH
jgi:hypothetical protein